MMEPLIINLRTCAPDSDSRERGAGRGAICRKEHRETERFLARSALRVRLN